MDLIIGAGISGLSYAAFTRNDYLILEKNDAPGGYCRTIRKDGFVWDFAGHFFHFSDPFIKTLVMDRIPPEKRVHVTKKNQIQYRDERINYPFQMNIHELPKDEFIDCLYDLFQNPFRETGSFKTMLYAKFGRSIAEKFLIPYNTKLYACDLDSLDADAMGRFFPYADKEEIIANFKTRENTSYNAHFIYPKDGAYEYARALSEDVDDEKLVLNEQVLSVDMDHHEVRTTRRILPYDKLISTMPLPHLFSMAGIPFDKRLYTSNRVLVLNIGFDKKGCETRNHWIYYPDDRYLFYRIGFYDNIYTTDRLSVYVEIGYRPDQFVNVEEAFNRTISDMRAAGLITDHRVVSWCPVLMDPAYVHINREMEKDRARKMAFLATKDIYSIGRYGAWTYCSMEDNVKEAKKLAESLSTSK